MSLAQQLTEEADSIRKLLDRGAQHAHLGWALGSAETALRKAAEALTFLAKSTPINRPVATDLPADEWRTQEVLDRLQVRGGKAVAFEASDDPEFGSPKGSDFKATDLPVDMITLTGPKGETATMLRSTYDDLFANKG